MRVPPTGGRTKTVGRSRAWLIRWGLMVRGSLFSWGLLRDCWPARAPVLRTGLQLQRVEQTEEDGQTRAPSQQPEDETAPAADDLRRNQDQLLKEGAEVHS